MTLASASSTQAAAEAGGQWSPGQPGSPAAGSDTHWGYDGAANPDATGILPKAVAAVNALPEPPDFVIFTGDLTHTTDIAHHAANALIFAQPVAGSQPKRTPPVAWDAAHPYRGLGWRRVEAKSSPVGYRLDEMPIREGCSAMGIDRNRRRLLGSFASSALVGLAWAQPPERVVQLVARRFVFTPERVALTVGQPVRLTLATLDVMMGFSCVELGLRADIVPDRLTTLRFTPARPGRFQFDCDVFCGSGHEDIGRDDRRRVTHRQRWRAA